MQGSLRLLYEPFLKKIKKAVVAVEYNEQKYVYFDITSLPEKKIMKIAGEKEFYSKIPRSVFKEFSSKLMELNIAVSDEYFDSELYTGFDFEKNNSQKLGIDTNG